MRDDVELRRQGARVCVTDGGKPRKGVPGRPRTVSATGGADEVDLAIAVLLEAVATDSLHPVGAAIYAPAG